MAHIIVLGAGISGLTAARCLSEAGHAVTIVDKGRGVGGRLATRRIDNARLDHGAQFFTTRGEAFTSTVASALDAGAVQEWCRGFGEPDGYPRYRGAAGMTSFAKWLARDLPISLATQVHSIEANGSGVRFVGHDATTIAAGDAAVVTAPIPQMLQLFDRGGIAPTPQLDAALRATDYFATFALLVVADGDSRVAAPGGEQHTSGPFTFVADNYVKGISEQRALTFHAAHDYSLRRLDDPVEQVRDELLSMAAPWIGAATVRDAQVARWRYAGPVQPLPEPTYLIESGSAAVALAGDAFAGPKVEGAFNSGLAAGQALQGWLS